MSTLAHFFLPYLLLYKYWALFGLTFIAALILPIPPGILIMGAAAMAYQGYMHFGWVLAAAIVGNILGDNVGYFLARKYGKSFLEKIGFRKIFTSPRYGALEQRLQKRPGFIIFISRFEVFANLSVNVMCGIARVPYRKYLIYEALGEIVQVTLYATLGYFFAPSWEIINKTIGNFMLTIFGVLAIAIIIIWKKFTKTQQALVK